MPPSNLQERLAELTHPARIIIDNEGNPLVFNSGGSLKSLLVDTHGEALALDQGRRLGVYIAVPTHDEVTCSCECYQSVNVVNAWAAAIDRGVVYEVSHIFNGINNNIAAEILITCHADYNMYVKININADCQIEYHIIEAPTITNNGNQLAAYNLRRDVGTPATALFYDSPTTTGGVSIFDAMDGSGKNAKASTDVGARILKKGTSYVISAINRSGNNNRNMSIDLDFMENA